MEGWEIAFFVLIYINMFLSLPIIVSLKEIIKKVRLFFNSKLVICEMLDKAKNSEEILVKPKGDFVEIKKQKYLIHPEFFVQRGKHRKIVIIDGVVMPSMYYNNFDFKTYLLTDKEEKSLNDEEKQQYANYIEIAKQKYERIIKYGCETFDNHICNAKLSSKLGQLNEYEKKVFYVGVALVIGILIAIVISFLFYNDMTPFIRAGFNPTNAKNGILSV